jgi:hypothetical protein
VVGLGIYFFSLFRQRLFNHELIVIYSSGVYRGNKETFRLVTRLGFVYNMDENT